MSRPRKAPKLAKLVLVLIVICIVSSLVEARGAGAIRRGGGWHAIGGGARRKFGGSRRRGGCKSAAMPGALPSPIMSSMCALFCVALLSLVH